MATKTEHFKLNLVDGNDIVDPLSYDNPNYQIIDEQMFVNQNNTIPLAEYEKNSNNHAITRLIKTANLFWFTASAEFNSGDSFSVDGQSVTAVYPDGTNLEGGSFTTGSNVVCILNDNVLTLLLPKVSGSVEYAAKAGKLNTPVNIGSASFDGSQPITLAQMGALSTTGAAASAKKLTTPVNIGSAPFDGSQPITLAQMGALSTTGAAASAKKLTTPVNIGSAPFDGSQPITLAQMGALSENAGIYSTSEIKTGKLWQSTDGNFYPVYRKVFNNIKVLGTPGITTTNLSGLTSTVVRDMLGTVLPSYMVRSNGNHTPINVYNPVISKWPGNNAVNIVLSGTQYQAEVVTGGSESGRSIVATIEYTKKSDSPVTP